MHEVGYSTDSKHNIQPGSCAIHMATYKGVVLSGINIWWGILFQKLGSNNDWCIHWAIILHLKTCQHIFHIFRLSDQNATGRLLDLHPKKIIHLSKITYLKFTNHRILELVSHSIRDASKNNIINIQAYNKEITTFNFSV